ncbi:DUF2959 domain-containing protein [Endozoicomonas sp. Mp262]|uniref:DUF2959 domain-containing protein n=1 Tax=Endozoicomonas sp. Mp262 TaxID=2919499 RepID=UPI0021D9132A
MKLLQNHRFLVLGVLVFMAGCQSTYYSAMEKVGIHKRDIMVDRIEDTQNAQENAQEQFKSALEKFRSVVHFDGGDLEDVYNQLNDEYENSVTAAEKVRGRIDGVKSVSDALFNEWEEELGQYSNSKLRRSSEQQLKTTRQNYKQMLASLEKSEQQMQPILDAFHDQVLYLKHNLNARAIAALKGEFGNIKADIERLVRDMQASIDQSKKFIATLKN